MGLLRSDPVNVEAAKVWYTGRLVRFQKILCA
jgi:hypothetical protein